MSAIRPHRSKDPFDAPPLMYTMQIPSGYAALPVIDTGAVIVVILVLTIVAVWMWLASLGVL